MAAKKTQVNATAEATKTRNRSFRRNPTIWPQPPTKPPNYRRNDYNPVRLQVCALSRGKTSVCKILILLDLLEGFVRRIKSTALARHANPLRKCRLRILSSLFP